MHVVGLLMLVTDFRKYVPSKENVKLKFYSYDCCVTIRSMCELRSSWLNWDLNNEMYLDKSSFHVPPGHKTCN